MYLRVLLWDLGVLGVLIVIALIFQLCNNLEYLDVFNFNKFKVTNMEFLFCKCSKLKEIIRINNFNTNNAINMMDMFQVCDNLKYLDISITYLVHISIEKSTSNKKS